MVQEKKEQPKVKDNLHPRSKHRKRYNFKKLIECYPDLKKYVKPNDYNDESIDFFNPRAVKTLNTALLKYYYDINEWDVPKDYLVPPIPGRADYIHYMADLLGESNKGEIPTGKKIRCLDIGTGANCIYPIVGAKEYNWSFTGTDIDPIAIKSAKKIILSNPHLEDLVDVRLQKNPNHTFHGIIQKQERYALSICNPPFHASEEDANAASQLKMNNLTRKKDWTPILNFGGQNSELWCEGGEKRFIRAMVRQSKQYANSCLWFSSLVSKKSNLKNIYEALKKVEAIEVKTIPMGQGNKTSRIVAWTFVAKEQHGGWFK